MPNLKKNNPLDTVQLSPDEQIELDILNYAKLKKSREQQAKVSQSISNTIFAKVTSKPLKPKPVPKQKQKPTPKPPHVNLTPEELRERRNERNRKKYALLKGSDVRARKTSIPCLNEEEKKERNRKKQRELYWEKHPEIKRNSKFRQSETNPPKEPKLPFKKLTAEELRQRQSERHRRRYALLKDKEEVQLKNNTLEVLYQQREQLEEEQRLWLIELKEKRQRKNSLSNCQNHLK